MPFFHIRLFFRIVAKSRDVYFLKVISLAVAFAASTLIGLFTLNEFGYDRFHEGHASIFRLLQRNNSESHSGNRLSNRIPPEVLPIMKAQSGDSMVISRVKLMSELSVIAAKEVLKDQSVHAADPDITRVFDFDIVHGSVNDFDTAKRTAVISSSRAQELFGHRNVAGEIFSLSALGDTVSFTIAAVFNDFPPNSHESFDIFIAFSTTSIRALHFDPGDIGVYGKVLSDHRSSLSGWIPQGGRDDLMYIFQPLSEIYFGPAVIGENAKHGDRYSIIIIICITALIFFLALTSFINLTTLTLPNRAKELAVKKLAGTTQWSLLATFAKESFTIVWIALTLGLLLLLLSSPFTEPILSIDLFSLMRGGDLTLIGILAALFFILGIAPLFMAGDFIKATPNRLLSTAVITFPRFKKIIIVLQLGISIFLIVASMVIKRQVDYSLLKEPGRNHDQVVYLASPPDLTSEGLRNLRSGWQTYNPNILDVMATSQLPNRVSSKEVDGDFYFMSVDPGFRDFFDLKMVQGNWFRANAGDSVLVINERGQELLGNDHPNILGVFKDMSGQFNQPEKPIKINLGPHYDYNFLCIRVLEVDIRRTVNYLSRTFAGDEGPPVISFLNKRFEDWLMYQDKLNRMSGMLAVISAILSCLAIYGLSISIVRDKLKPIAIHKLCGAGTLGITRLLVKEFTGQMALAIVISGPLTYIILKELLRTFVYSTQFIWLDPLIPLGYCVVVIAMLCGFQALSLNREDLSAALKA